MLLDHTEEFVARGGGRLGQLVYAAIHLVPWRFTGHIALLLSSTPSSTRTENARQAMHWYINPTRFLLQLELARNMVCLQIAGQEFEAIIEK